MFLCFIPRCVQMRLYSMNKGEITFVYFIFIILLLLALIIGLSGKSLQNVLSLILLEVNTEFFWENIYLAGPPIEYTNYKNISESTTSIIFGQNGLEHGGPFNLTTPPLSRYNKQLWLFAILHTENVDGRRTLMLNLYCKLNFCHSESTRNIFLCRWSIRWKYAIECFGYRITFVARWSKHC